jgi:YidC/Oxa1 family membrane protein insertase
LDSDAKTKEAEAKVKAEPTVITAGDTMQLAQLQKFRTCLFSYTPCEGCLHIENKLVKLKIAIRVVISEATLKNFERFREGSGQLVKLIKDNNAHLNVQAYQ